jgi:hypothetical protein
MVERLHLPDAWVAIEHFYRQPWSDGLPVEAPTEALVYRMLDTVERRPEEVVGLVNTAAHR